MINNAIQNETTGEKNGGGEIIFEKKSLTFGGVR